MKEEIVRILSNHSQKSVIGWALEEEDFDNVAEKIVKLFAMPGVSCSVPSDLLDFIKKIAGSDERLYREKAKSLVRRYCN